MHAGQHAGTSAVLAGQAFEDADDRPGRVVGLSGVRRDPCTTTAHSSVCGWRSARLWIDWPALPPEQRNMLWWMFTDPAARTVLVDWEAEAAALLARYRAAVGRHPDDPALRSSPTGCMPPAAKSEPGGHATTSHT